MGRSEVPPRHGGGKELERLELFSDAVFAIAITLLVLELKVPEAEAVRAAGGLGKALIGEIPRFYAYFIGFILIGNYWILHHRMFRCLRRCDEGLVALNLLLLLFVAFLPFPVALFGAWRRDPVGIGGYILSMAATGASLNLLWGYAVARRRLVAPDLDDRVVRFMWFRTAVVPLVFMVSLPFAFVSPLWMTFSLGALAPILRFFGRRLERAARAAESPAVEPPMPAPAPRSVG